MIEDFVTLANVCDDNGWTCNGVIFEPGDKWANLKSILQAGGAEPCFRNGRLGLRINAPRVSLDTITVDDLADGENVFPAMQSYRDRLNTIIPKYRAPDQKWEYVATQEPVQVSQFVTEDGEEKSEERQYNLVTNPNQAAQLAGYDLANGREAGPVELVCKPRMRRYGPGDMLTLNIPEAGEMFTDRDFVILNRTADPASMTVSLTLVSENPNKHPFALGLTGTAPPAITIPGPEEADNVAGSIGDMVITAPTEVTAAQSAPLKVDLSWRNPKAEVFDYATILTDGVEGADQLVGGLGAIMAVTVDATVGSHGYRIRAYAADGSYADSALVSVTVA